MTQSSPPIFCGNPHSQLVSLPVASELQTMLLRHPCVVTPLKRRLLYPRFSSPLPNLKIVSNGGLQHPFGGVRPSALVPALTRGLASAVADLGQEEPETGVGSLDKIRNIGISAHIDSGKTTATERILYYTGRIRSIHDVRGKDGVGAKMDSMELEREKGITIQSAATHCLWNGHHINIIDTPGHVDFTIEVERALRVLDGAVLLLCGVSGVQSQSLTVDRQMKRYSVPRLAFINKLDRVGCSPWRVVKELRKQLRLNAAAVQIPIGLEENHVGVVDVINGVAYYFEGAKGENPVQKVVPEDLVAEMESTRQVLVECLADADDQVAELFLSEEHVPPDVIEAAIHRQTIALKFVPVFMGSAYKNKGIQPLLDGVVKYLPSPLEVPQYALDISKGEEKVPIDCSREAPTLALAFKLEEGRYGQLTYMRIYQGIIKKGQFIFNQKTGKKVKVPRLVRLHADQMEEVDWAGAGDVVALFGVDCSSMDSFTDGTTNLVLSSMFVPEPVMSLALKPDRSSKSQQNFSKALQRFTREDPTLRVHTDEHSKEVVISGMGELHLEVYLERLRREYEVVCQAGQPAVNYHETISSKVEFNYLHKKQTGGSGQYAQVMGYIEPLRSDEAVDHGIEKKNFKFVNGMIGNNIPPEYVPSCERGFEDAMKKGGLIGAPIQGIRVTLTDGASHAVDSSDMAFRIAAASAAREAIRNAGPHILEPVMAVEVMAPAEFQGALVTSVNKRMGLVQDASMSDDGANTVVRADVPLANMFGYSTELRSATQGKGEFSMDYKRHQTLPRDVQEKLIKDYLAEKQLKSK